MSKTIKMCYYDKLTFDNLLSAYKRATKNKGLKSEVIKFEMDLETNIVNIYNSLYDLSYKCGKYREFTIYEPKERLIKSLPLKDRIVQQWYIHEFIKPYILPRFINDTYACIDSRGTLKSALKVEKYMRIMKRKYNNYYVLKCDIKKYFYNINKEILFNIMKKYISDKKLILLTHNIIFDDESILSIPIGNYTSQYFANIYLNELDYFVKTKLKIKYYVRYMDDFVLLLKTKEECKNIKKKIEIFLKKHLSLELNNKSVYYPNSKGINFCGYRIYETHKLIRERCKKKIKKNVKKWNELYNVKKVNLNYIIVKWNSFKSHIKHANSYNFKLKIYNSMNFKRYIKFNLYIILFHRFS